ncbi:ABC transporter ATP-binding protein [Verminephrobacter aporrectodeae]|uniref:ABC transporter ATP-binding protein n=1 Tax=Verminephrobacter aporrectodeae subsp. tuberculatae TaxID=1110392 RepID=A0ABT3KWD4_9BURK|nr:oligopeptide/dipeptide ABC transporter ATP-binding protein [Verminephrobacter aporrectodeae]MCW5223065.1 ABC transporter ATP-binding protein [Verminephrobacter aporrectodeae subsp. tuberculatae]MCW5256718.1 ABC transporter ATP-binding protein [Verminephrobacter aporrectodeae subsp. tuberculatae]MCW5288529.1 ABC transporter ATP-binding protein [Verminephrobacter aporrectodeae subsp. tuberculatae]MCW5322115.1 ABC transporter ATP-binding protein [Verminephrobacter aporrectodeae subsp. tubercula
MTAHQNEPGPDALLTVEGLSKHFPVANGVVKAVDGVSFKVQRGSIVGLVGESGSGKTTVGRSLLRLIQPSGGRALFDGADLFALSNAEMRAYRRRLQIVFQDPYSSLNPRLRVEDILGEAIDTHGLAKGAARKERISELLVQVGLAAEHGRRFPHEFSGGQRQRIGIARALAVQPEFIVADEPVSALDVSVQAQVLNLLQELQAAYGLTMLFITHDLSVVEYLCDQVVVMYLGRVMEQGPSRQLFANPRHPYTRALLSASPVPDPKARRQRIVLQGDIPSPFNPPSGCVFRTRCPHAIDACAQAVPAAQTLGADHVVSCIRQAELA